MEKKTVRDIEVNGKRVLVRVDFNVPIDEKTGRIMDDSRIHASIPTIQYLVNHGARVILCSHLGRPKGIPEAKYSLKPAVPRLAGMLGKPVAFATDCIGPEAEKAVAKLKNGDVLLLENVRFHAEEETGDDGFARALARLADVYVDDAFGTAHRNHVSIVGVAKYLPAVAGLLLEKELATLGGLLENPQHPFAALLGGAKVSDKVALMQNMLSKLDLLMIGGGMAATFLKATGYEIVKSIFEENLLSIDSAMMKTTAESGPRLLLPLDVVVTDEVNEKGSYQVVLVDKVPADRAIVDIGPQTVQLFGTELGDRKSVV